MTIEDAQRVFGSDHETTNIHQGKYFIWVLAFRSICPRPAYFASIVELFHHLIVYVMISLQSGEGKNGGKFDYLSQKNIFLWH